MLRLIQTLTRYRYLLLELTRREFADRYAKQIAGSAWAWLHPLLILSLYASVFSFVFTNRMPAHETGLSFDYTSYVLAGLVPWLYLQDVLSRASEAISSHRGYVKQMAFPIDILPIKGALSSLPILVIGTIFVFMYYTIKVQFLTLTLFLWPIMLLLILIYASGIMFFISSIYIYWRDAREIVSVFTTANLFLIPAIFIPNQAPPFIGKLFWLNPFSYPVWIYQDLFFYGRIEHPMAWAGFALIASLTFSIGFRTFQKLRPQFGDVI